MRFKIVFSLIVILSFFLGSLANIYAFEVKYELNPKDIKKTSVVIDKKLAVIIFDDIRPDIEKSAKTRLENIIEDANLYTEDWAYVKNDDKKQKYNVSQQISKMIAEHLSQSGLFKKVDFVDIQLSEILDKNNKELFNSYDLVLTGKIKHYYGFCKVIGNIKSEGAGVILALAGGVVGGALGGAIEGGEYEALPKKIEGYTALTEIKLIDLKSNRVIWNGEATSRFKDTKTKYASNMYVESHNSLRNAVNSLIEKLDKAKIK